MKGRRQYKQVIGQVAGYKEAGTEGRGKEINDCQ